MDTLYVVDVDGEQAIARTEGEAKSLILEKWQEKLAKLFPETRDVDAKCGVAKFDFYFHAEVYWASGKTGWTKTRR